MFLKRTGFIQIREIKSRRDDTLLTVDFNLRTGNVSCPVQNPAGMTLLTINSEQLTINNYCSYCSLTIVSSLRDFADYSSCRLFRRLKSTVNKVLSLRDISPLTQFFYKFFYFTSLKLKLIIH